MRADEPARLVTSLYARERFKIRRLDDDGDNDDDVDFSNPSVFTTFLTFEFDRGVLRGGGANIESKRSSSLFQWAAQSL